MAGQASSVLPQFHLAQRVTTINEEDAAGLEGSLDRGASEDPGLGVSTVQRADTDGDGEIEFLLAFAQREGFGGRLPESEGTGGDFSGGAGFGLADGGGGAVDGEHKPPALETAGDCPRHGAGSAADLDNAKTRSQRQGLDDVAETSRKRFGHSSTGARKFWLSQPEVPSVVVT